MNTQSSIVKSLLLVLSLSLAGQARASLVYYVPFDNGTSSSLTNYGTAGGTASISAGNYGASVPALSNANVAPNLGSISSANFNNGISGGGAGGAVSLPNSTTQFRLGLSTDRMTVSTWIYVDTLADSGIVNTLPSNNATGWTFAITPAGKLRFNYLNTNGGYEGGQRLTANSVITTGQWYNVAMTWNSSTDNALRFYVNGVLAPLPDNYTGLSTLNTAGQDIALGTFNHDALFPNPQVDTNVGGQGALKGSMDDFAMWNTLLTPAKIASLNTAPGLLSGYNAGVMDSLFTVFDAGSGSQTVGSLTWNYASGFDATGHSLGDTWLSGGNNYIWLDGSIGSANGLIAAVPEPQVTLLLAGAGLALCLVRRRKSV